MSAVQEDLVCVVMPVHNGAPYLEASIESVRAQSHANWKLFVVDDCSTDDSARIAQRVADTDARVRVSRTPRNGGSSAARNLGLARCDGPFVAFLDADDLWHPSKLEKQLALTRKAKASFSFTAYRKFGEAGPGGVIHADSRVSWHDMLKGNRIGCSTVMLDARVHTHLAFPLGLGRQEDYALWLSLLRDGTCAHGLDEPLVEYRVHASSKSSRKLPSVLAQWRVYREFEGLSRLRALWYLGHYAVRGMLKSLR